MKTVVFESGRPADESSDFHLPSDLELTVDQRLSYPPRSAKDVGVDNYVLRTGWWILGQIQISIFFYSQKNFKADELDGREIWNGLNDQTIKTIV